MAKNKYFPELIYSNDELRKTGWLSKTSMKGYCEDSSGNIKEGVVPIRLFDDENINKAKATLNENYIDNFHKYSVWDNYKLNPEELQSYFQTKERINYVFGGYGDGVGYGTNYLPLPALDVFMRYCKNEKMFPSTSVIKAPFYNEITAKYNFGLAFCDNYSVYVNGDYVNGDFVDSVDNSSAVKNKISFDNFKIKLNNKNVYSNKTFGNSQEIDSQTTFSYKDYKLKDVFYFGEKLCSVDLTTGTYTRYGTIFSPWAQRVLKATDLDSDEKKKYKNLGVGVLSEVSHPINGATIMSDAQNYVLVGVRIYFGDDFKKIPKLSEYLNETADEIKSVTACAFFFRNKTDRRLYRYKFSLDDYYNKTGKEKKKLYFIPFLVDNKEGSNESNKNEEKGLVEVIYKNDYSVDKDKTRSYIQFGGFDGDEYNINNSVEPPNRFVDAPSDRPSFLYGVNSPKTKVYEFPGNSLYGFEGKPTTIKINGEEIKNENTLKSVVKIIDCSSIRSDIVRNKFFDLINENKEITANKLKNVIVGCVTDTKPVLKKAEGGWAFSYNGNAIDVTLKPDDNSNSYSYSVNVKDQNGNEGNFTNFNLFNLIDPKLRKSKKEKESKFKLLEFDVPGSDKQYSSLEEIKEEFIEFPEKRSVKAGDVLFSMKFEADNMSYDINSSKKIITGLYGNNIRTIQEGINYKNYKNNPEYSVSNLTEKEKEGGSGDNLRCLKRPFTTYVVMHWMCGSLDDCIPLYYKASDELSTYARYYVSRTGEIYSIGNVEHISWHAGWNQGGIWGKLQEAIYDALDNSYKVATKLGLVDKNGNKYNQRKNNINRYAVGIEMEEKVRGSSKNGFTDETIESSAKLAAWLCSKYGIDKNGIEKGHLCRHFDISGKVCPGPFVGISEIKESSRIGSDGIETKRQIDLETSAVDGGENKWKEFKELVIAELESGLIDGSKEFGVQKNSTLNSGKKKLTFEVKCMATKNGSVESSIGYAINDLFKENNWEFSTKK